MNREELICLIAEELEQHAAFKGEDIKSLVWATRIVQKFGNKMLEMHVPATADELQTAYNCGFNNAQEEASLYFVRYSDWNETHPHKIKETWSQFKEDVRVMHPGPYEYFHEESSEGQKKMTKEEIFEHVLRMR